MALWIFIGRRGAAIRVFAALMVASAVAGQASAQRVTGPFARLFGAGTHGTETQLLEFRGVFGAAYDKNPTGSDALFNRFGGDPRINGLGAAGNAGLNYERQSNRVNLTLFGDTRLRTAHPQAPLGVQADTANLIVGAYDLGGLTSAHLRSNVTLDATGSVTYEPFFQFTPQGAAAAPLDAPLSNLQFDVFSRRNRTVMSSLGTTYQYARHSSLSGSLSWRSTRFPELSDADLDSWSGRAAFLRHVTRSWSVGLDAARDDVSYRLGLVPRAVNDSFSVSATYGSLGSPERRLSFAASARAMVPQLGDQRKVRFGGDVRVARGFGRTWSALLGYSRSTDFAVGIPAPLFSDSASLSVNGLIGLRAQLSSAIGASRGQVGFSAQKPFTTYYSSSKLTVGMTRQLAGYGQYEYYNYQFPAEIAAIEGVPQLSRHRISAGITLWIPLATELKVPLDPR